MSSVNPHGAVRAFIGSAFPFRERRRIPFLRRKRSVVLTGAVIAALELLDLDSERLDAFLVVSCVLYAATRARSRLLAEMQLPRAEFARRALRWGERQFPRPEDLDAARAIVAAMFDDYAASACSYASRDSAAESLAEYGLGERIAVCAALMHAYGVSFEDALFMPCTRANALYYAECERVGMEGVDTFLRREILAEAAKLLPFFNFQ